MPGTAIILRTTPAHGHVSRIRELEVYTRLDWVSAVPWPRLYFMQRNKVAFDSPEALTHALNSPVRHEMRADFRTFPKLQRSQQPLRNGDQHDRTNAVK